jgi:hypothetical protein
MGNEPEKRSRAWIGWAAGLLLFVVYPLSMGPAFRSANQSLFEDPNKAQWRATLWVYAPIFWLSDHSEWAARFHSWYLGIWLP